MDVQEGQRRRSGVLVDVQEEGKHVFGSTEEKKQSLVNALVSERTKDEDGGRRCVKFIFF